MIIALRIFFIVFAIVAAIAVFTTKKARAHSWYDNDCCNVNDCKPVAAEDMEEIGPNVWRYKPTGNIFKDEPNFKRIRPSRDQNYHPCISPYTKTSYCLYIPVGS